MKRSRFSEEQVIGILKEHEVGVSVAELCRKHAMSSALVEENARMKKLLADALLDNAGLKDLLSRKW